MTTTRLKNIKVVLTSASLLPRYGSLNNIRKQSGLILFQKLSPEIKIYFLGSGNDTLACQHIIETSHHPNAFNLSGKLNFLESAALMEHATMNFVNDSAPQHLASAVNAPVTSIFCSTVPEFGFGPLSDDSVIIETTEKLSCRPCGLHGYRACPEKHFKCALTIQTEQLLNRIK